MAGIKYADAGMDMKKFVLLLIKNCWIALLTALVCAVAGGALYLALHIVPEAEREYRAVSKLYLTFAADETGEVYQAYNGYTWNDLMATEPILDVTMANLPDGYSREEVVGATQAEILSDIRLLTITVTTHEAQRTDAILSATDKSLEKLGETAKEFIQIETIQTTEAALVVADSRLAQAVAVGFVIGLLASLLGIMFLFLLDDRILVASDFRQVTDTAFLGYSFGGQASDKTAQILQADYERNLSYMEGKVGSVSVYELNPQETIEAEELSRLREKDGVILQVPYRKIHAVYLEYVLENFKVNDCKVIGLAVCGADEKFLKVYYGGLV